MPCRFRGVHQQTWKVSTPTFSFSSLVAFRMRCCRGHLLPFRGMSAFDGAMLNIGIISRRCCKAGGDCCKSDGELTRDLPGSIRPDPYTSRTGCCRPGSYCYSTGCCKNGYRGCEGNSCCAPGESCCSGGGCCKLGYISELSYPQTVF